MSRRRGEKGRLSPGRRRSLSRAGPGLSRFPSYEAGPRRVILGEERDRGGAPVPVPSAVSSGLEGMEGPAGTGGGNSPKGHGRMKIAMIGAHGVGKTTLCFEVAAFLKKQDNASFQFLKVEILECLHLI